MTNKPTDHREFVRVAVDLADHPKLAELDDPAASWAYVVALCYAGKHLTDGVIPLRPVARKAGASLQKIRKLVRVGMLHEHGHTCKKCPEIEAGKAVIHDYLEHQRSRGEAQEQRRSKQEAGRKGAAARWAKQAPATPSTSYGTCHDTSNGKPMPEEELEIDTHLGNYAASGVTRDEHAAAEPEPAVPSTPEPRPAEPADPPARGRATTGPTGTQAQRLVARIIGPEYPPSVRQTLAWHTAESLRNTNPDLIRAALETWRDRPDIGPGILPSLIADQIKRKAGAGDVLRAGGRRREGTGSRRVDKALSALAPDDPLRAELLGTPTAPTTTETGFRPVLIEGNRTA